MSLRDNWRQYMVREISHQLSVRNCVHRGGLHIGPTNTDNKMTDNKKYLFADESGNFDFRDPIRYRGASRFFAVGTVMIEGDNAVAALQSDLHDLRRQLAWNHVNHDAAFHATEDTQAVRDAVFGLLESHNFAVDVTLLEKTKAQPHLYSSEQRFYQYAWWFHFKYLAPRQVRSTDELMVVAASLGTKGKRAAFKAGVEDVVRQCTDVRVPRQVAFWPVDSEPCLQVADYAVWAVTRAWEKGDRRALDQLGGKVRTQYDYFKFGSTHYYGPLAAKPASA